jgi:DNA-binding HxlR family transcriptional regulator
MSLDDCPIRPALKVIGGKWKPVILYHLMNGEKRHGELRRLVPGASQKVLTQHLRELESDGILARRTYPGTVPKVGYQLTPLGETLKPVMQALCLWGKSFKDQAAAADHQSTQA